MVAITAELLDGGPWAGITVSGLSAGNHVVTVWRSVSGAREAVSGGKAWAVIDSDYLIDYAVPLGRWVSYQVEVTAGPDAGAVVPAVDVFRPSDCGFIHDPLDPTAVVPVWATRAPSGEPVLAGTAFAQLVRAADVSVHNIIGSSLPVAIGGQRRAASGVDLSVLTDAEAQNTALRDMVEQSAVVVVRTPPGWFGDAWPAVAYVAMPEVVEQPLTAHKLHEAGRYLTRWGLVGQVVRGSSAPVLISLFTYDDVAALYATYDQKQASAGGGSYLDDLKNPLGA